MLNNVNHLKSYLYNLTDFIEKKGVVIHHDICNEQGAIIIPKGRDFDEALAERLATYKLEKPLEQCIEVKNSLTSDKLYSLFKKVISEHSELDFIHSNGQLDTLLKQACDYYQTFPVIVQKVTVLRDVLPNKFKQAFLTAYISLSIANKMGAKEHDCLNVFVAGLVHDLGMLHLPINVSMEKEPAHENFLETDQHSVIGFEFLKQIPDFPNCIARAVLEHHERYDGSGFPEGKQGLELGMIGQIIALSDTCVALYARELANKKLGFDALLPVLKLNPDQFCPQVFQATIELIKSVDWPKKRLHQNAEMPKVISCMMIENESIKHDYYILYGLLTSIKPFITNNEQTESLTQLSEEVRTCMEHSGILNNEHNEWLVISCGAQQDRDYILIDHLGIMYAELKSKVKTLNQQLYAFWKQGGVEHKELNKRIRHGLWQISYNHKQHNQEFVQ